MRDTRDNAPVAQLPAREEGPIIYDLAQYRLAREQGTRRTDSLAETSAPQPAEQQTGFGAFLDRWDKPAALVIGGLFGGGALATGLSIGSASLNVIGAGLLAMTAVQTVRTVLESKN